MNTNIPVIILCGGKGTRLREETEFIPKPLIKVGDKPLLWHIMKIYNAYGFNDFILPVGYKGEKIKEYFSNYDILQGSCTIDFRSGDKRIFAHFPPIEKWKVTIVDTGIETQTGSRIGLIEPYLHNDVFLLTYGDGVANINIDALLKFHLEQGKMATVTAVHPSARFGEIEVQNNLAMSFWEKPHFNQGYINGGFFVLNKSVFSYLKDSPMLNFEKNVLPVLAKERQLAVFCHEGYWQCMDTIRDMEALNEIWATGDVPWKIWKP